MERMYFPAKPESISLRAKLTWEKISDSVKVPTSDAPIVPINVNIPKAIKRLNKFFIIFYFLSFVNLFEWFILWLHYKRGYVLKNGQLKLLQKNKVYDIL